MTDLAQSPAAEADVTVTAALWAALRSFGRLPGASIRDEDDVTLILSGSPYANFNNVIASAIADADADRRISEILRGFRSTSLPVTWWISPTTQPADLAARLQTLGLARQEPEFAMVLDLDAGWPEARLPGGATLEPVEQFDQLDAWLGVMNAAYRWPDAAKTAIIRSMYLATLSLPVDARDIHHWLIRLDGRPAACSSLFVGDGHAFVTNIGTRPDARGRGLGSAATGRALELARELGRGTSTLTASVDGRGVYRRLGFREAGTLERYVATESTVAQLAGRLRSGRR